MIVYNAVKSKFLQDIETNEIDEIILRNYKLKTQRSVGKSEISSWKNSLENVYRVLVDPLIPAETGIAVEFNIPQSSKRMDLVLSGWNAERRRTAVIIELKQWESLKSTGKDAIVETILGGNLCETSHPSYQAWSYAALLEDFNEAIETENIQLKPCCYLHNCKSDEVVNHEFYQSHTTLAPAFIRSDAEKLKLFIKQHIKYGDACENLFLIDEGKIRPSKQLADALSSLLKGNREFVMIDDQKLVYETALQLSRKSTEDEKQVLVVNGGPGTGKSVVAVNLLVALTARGKVSKYVSKNAAPRKVYESKLTGLMTQSRISNMFSGSGGFVTTEPNTFDALIVDEAHRLNEKSGLYQNLGENQILELIRSSKLSVFFLDEDQRVTLKDIGDRESILRWAALCGATVQEMTLSSQFRCNGSDGYLAWLDSLLRIRETANVTLVADEFDFRVFESASALHATITELNAVRNKARTVAGYCWDWKSKKDPSAMDIVIPESNFYAQWNLTTDGNLWILKPDSVAEIGCVHTCQGLELEYVGVLMGRDMVYRNGDWKIQPGERSRMDNSMKGYKSLLNTPEATKIEAVVKNTYRTLMTRGQKGCFVHSVDPETNEYLKSIAPTIQ
jgi:DUF2075 family protein